MRTACRPEPQDGRSDGREAHGWGVAIEGSQSSNPLLPLIPCLLSQQRSTDGSWLDSLSSSWLSLPGSDCCSCWVLGVVG